MHVSVAGVLLLMALLGVLYAMMRGTPKRRGTSFSATVMAVTRPITRCRAWTLRWRQSQMMSGSAQTALSNSEALVCMLHVAMPQLRHGPIQQ